MDVIDALRKAEQQGLGVAQRKLDAVRGTWEDAERRLRRKMRVFPQSLKRKPTAPPGVDKPAA